MNKPTLWVMCGLSGSGKSTVAAQITENNENTVIISSDAIREELTGNYEDQEHNEEVFKIFHDRIRKNLENKKNVVADATNLTMESRRAILMKVNGLNIRKVCVIIPKPFEQCKENNLHREHPVPDFVLDKQIRKFQIPFYNEGFDDIVIKHFDQVSSMITVLTEMNDFDQKTPYHDKTLGKHSGYTTRLFEKYDYPKYYMLSAIYHDVGKLYTQTFDDNGIAHYYGHAEYSAYLVLSELHDTFTDLSDDEFLDTCFLINYHMMPFNWTTDKTKQRWKERFGEYKYQMLLDFNECDKAR